MKKVTSFLISLATILLLRLFALAASEKESPSSTISNALLSSASVYFLIIYNLHIIFLLKNGHKNTVDNQPFVLGYYLRLQKTRPSCRVTYPL